MSMEALFPERRWLLNLIRRAELMRIFLPAELLAVYRANGFET